MNFSRDGGSRASQWASLEEPLSFQGACIPLDLGANLRRAAPLQSSQSLQYDPFWVKDLGNVRRILTQKAIISW
jgi:hypothetical protein